MTKIEHLKESNKAKRVLPRYVYYEKFVNFKHFVETRHNIVVDMHNSLGRKVVDLEKRLKVYRLFIYGNLVLLLIFAYLTIFQ